MATAGSTGSINLTKKASPKVLERFKFGSCTEGLFSTRYSWSGVATVQIYTVDNLPLNNYDPEKVDGGSRFGNLINVGDTIQELTVKDNKSFIGVIEETYNTQQMQIKRAGEILRRQTDEVMIPYTDKYRLNKLASYATAGRGNLVTANLTKANIVENIMVANAAMSEKLVPDTGRVLYMTYGVAIRLKLADQVVGAQGYGGVGKGTLGEKAIVNGVIGKIDKCQIKLVPAGYLPAGVAFMIVKSGEAFAPLQIKSYKVHDGQHVLDGKIVTGHLLHDCFIPEGREDCVFVVKDTTNADGAAKAGALSVVTGTGSDGATISSSAIAKLVLSAGTKTVDVSTANTIDGTTYPVTGDVISVVSSDESKLKAVYNPTRGVVELTPLALGSSITFTVTANGKPGFTSPAPVTITVTSIAAS